MRYYLIEVDGKPRWSSMNADGSPNFNAQNVEMDVLVYQGQANYGHSQVTIQGPPIAELLDANNLYESTISVYAGMQQGLPLAQPHQIGPLFVGQVFQSYANWVGTDMEIALILTPTPHHEFNPGNYSFVWNKGQPLADALKATFDKALPGYKQKIKISPNVVAFATHAGIYYTLEELASSIAAWTSSYFPSLGNPYLGVQIGVSKGVISVTDATQAPSGMVQIDFLDLIGQPTWIGANRLQFITVMRGDIGLGSVVKMPEGIENIPGFVTTTAQSMPSQLRYKSTFRGPFSIISTRHIGNFRAANGELWCSVFEAVPFNGS